MARPHSTDGPYRIARKADEYKSIGHRDVGRPKRRWEDDF
jgi:hypothetical protein